MRLNDPGLRNVFETWRTGARDVARAGADNLWFEERVGARRQAVFEDQLRGAGDADALGKRWIDYYERHIKTDADEADSFRADLDPAVLPPADDFRPIIRLENIRRPLREWENERGAGLDELRNAIAAENTASVDDFLAIWKVTRDNRPLFAAFRCDVEDVIMCGDWPRSNSKSPRSA